ncbi:MAG TPA: hypothetical protein VMT37_06035 [Solirubrobacterales bacterium]|nr:hypothetical protein [Solirubrobacterales bacterium]
MADPVLTGGCNCGAVRFELSEPPASAGYCHGVASAAAAPRRRSTPSSSRRR